MKHKSIIVNKIILLLIFSILSFKIIASEHENQLRNGIKSFKKTDYRSAIKDFRDIITDPNITNYDGDAYFWMAKSYIALAQFDNAQKNLEYFIENYRAHKYYQESVYQKGRLLYLQNDYENSISLLYLFIKQNPKSPFVGNAYYWIGESLYSIGHFEDSYSVFAHVVQKYPTSFKIESSKYKLSLIDLQKREEELLKFLKWSHEESLKSIEEFQRREKTYEQILFSYQKKLAAYAEQQSLKELEALEIENERLKSEIAGLKSELQQSKLAIIDTEGVTDPEANEELQRKLRNTRNKNELLKIKSDALKIKESYIDELLNSPETK